MLLHLVFAWIHDSISNIFIEFRLFDCAKEPFSQGSISRRRYDICHECIFQYFNVEIMLVLFNEYDILWILPLVDQMKSLTTSNT